MSEIIVIPEAPVKRRVGRPITTDSVGLGKEYFRRYYNATNHPVTCACGANVTRNSLLKHMKRPKHALWLAYKSVNESNILV
jgi:hypothetical protein